MQLSLNLRDKVSEEGATSVGDKRAGLEEIHGTHGGRLAQLLVAGGQPLHYGTDEIPLALVLGTRSVYARLCDVLQNSLHRIKESVRDSHMINHVIHSYMYN